MSERCISLQETGFRYLIYMRACSVVSDSLQPRDCSPARLFCLWNFPGKNTWVICHFLLQGIFPTRGLNLCLLCLLHCPQILYHQAAGNFCQIPLGRANINLPVLNAGFSPEESTQNYFIPLQPLERRSIFKICILLLSNFVIFYFEYSGELIWERKREDSSQNPTST